MEKINLNLRKEVLENALPYLGIQPDYTQEELQQKEVQKVTVPDFRNMTIKDAKNQADEVSIEVEIQGEGQYITSQFPMPGEMINKTTKIILYTQ